MDAFCIWFLCNTFFCERDSGYVSQRAWGNRWASAFLCQVFVVYGQVIVETWVGKSLVVENWMLFAFGFYAILSSVSVIQAMFLNALGK